MLLHCVFWTCIGAAWYWNLSTHIMDTFDKFSSLLDLRMWHMMSIHGGSINLNMPQFDCPDVLNLKGALDFNSTRRSVCPPATAILLCRGEAHNVEKIQDNKRPAALLYRYALDNNSRVIGTFIMRSRIDSNSHELPAPR